VLDPQSSIQVFNVFMGKKLLAHNSVLDGSKKQLELDLINSII